MFDVNEKCVTVKITNVKAGGGYKKYLNHCPLLTSKHDDSRLSYITFVDCCHLITKIKVICIDGACLDVSYCFNYTQCDFEETFTN